jgi:hypothetical protein
VLEKCIKHFRDYRSPIEFFHEFDGHLDRKFQVWELMAMFELSYP